jgi:hypothetical protein
MITSIDANGARVEMELNRQYLDMANDVGDAAQAIRDGAIRIDANTSDPAQQASVHLRPVGRNKAYLDKARLVR